MGELKRYRTLVSDSARWDGFRFRPDDIVISTPPKSGTTWTQMLCALLIFDTAELDRPLGQIAPWLDQLTTPLDVTMASLEAQSHRRFIKTHTPLDGIPFDERVTYLCVGRDPRDVAMSFQHHMANMDMEVMMRHRANTVGLDDLNGLPPRPQAPDDPIERFWIWADSEPDRITGVLTLASILEHLSSFWPRQDEPNIALFHYSDLKADLPGQLRRLADVLSIDRPEGRIAELSAAATFDAMKARADDLAPGAANGVWRSNAEFFHRGTSGQWRDLLDDDGVRRYDQRVAELVSPDLAAWAHAGWLEGQVQPPR